MSEANLEKDNTPDELPQQFSSDLEPDSLEFNRLASRIRVLKYREVQEIFQNVGGKTLEQINKKTLRPDLLMLCKSRPHVAQYVLSRRIPSHCSYDYICVVDFEATCIKHGKSIDFYPHEIIEFPATLIDVKELEIVDSFHSYVKPVINPKLTDFCRELTGISQETVDQAKKFGNVLKCFEDWLFAFVQNEKFIFLTDGSADIENFLSTSCIVNDVKFPSYARKWIDMKAVYRDTYMTRRSSKRLVDILKKLGIEFEGRLHSGKDDAQNIAKIAITALKDGVELKFTNKLRTQKYRQLKQNVLCYMKKNASEDSLITFMLKNAHEEKKIKKKQNTRTDPNTNNHLMDIDSDIGDAEILLARLKVKR